MRPVDKGTRAEQFKPYRKAKLPLTETIGWYCSYCEMKVAHKIEVEHVVPQANGGAKYDWENFLLGCSYCNGAANKSDNNKSRKGYYWPDTDNTLRAFEYLEKKIIQPDSNLSQGQKKIAQNTIDLLGLDKAPYTGKKPSPADIRWLHRDSAWTTAKDALKDWIIGASEPLKNSIAREAAAKGFFSIWVVVFKDHPQVKRALVEKFKGTALDCFDNNGNPVSRPGGLL